MVKFNEVEVVYPNKLKAFIDSGRQDVTLKFCKAKYLFYYDFMPDTILELQLTQQAKLLVNLPFLQKKNINL